MLRTTASLLGAVMLAACSTAPAMKVETEHDPAQAAQLLGYRTYRVQPAPTQGPVDDVAMGGAIVRSIEETLGDKGYRQDASRPDFLVQWRVSIASRQRTTTMDTPAFRDVGPIPSAPNPSVPVTVSRQGREGTLVLDLVDTGSNRVVWRGSAQAELGGFVEPQSRHARIHEAVRLIFERFPPQ